MKTTCGFAAAVHHILLFILSETQRTLDSGGKLWAYLGRLVHLDQTTPGIGRHPNHQRRAAAQQDADLDSLLRQPRSTYFCEQSQTPVDVPESPSPHCRWQRRQPGGARWTGPPSCANSSGGIPHAYSQRPAPVYVGAASQNALRMTFVLEAEAISFDTEVVAYLSQLAGEDHMRFCGSCQPHIAVHPLRNPPYARKRRQAFWGTFGSTRNTSPAIDLASGAARAINSELQPSKIQI